jgi:hypothetical protein
MHQYVERRTQKSTTFSIFNFERLAEFWGKSQKENSPTAIFGPRLNYARGDPLALLVKTRGFGMTTACIR